MPRHARAGRQAPEDRPMHAGDLGVDQRVVRWNDQSAFSAPLSRPDRLAPRAGVMREAGPNTG